MRFTGPGRHADGNDLYLFVRPNGARGCWVQRLVIEGRRRDLGLSGYPLVVPADAWLVVAENRGVARLGGDPVAGGVQRLAPTVREVVSVVIRSVVIGVRRASWRNPATERKWRRLLETLVLSCIGDKSAAAVTLEDLSVIVLPHWRGCGSTG